jgi:hypothetical protein
MDPFLIDRFKEQIVFECDCALRAAEQTNAALKVRDTVGVFFGLQNFLTAAANLSKCLWGQKQQKTDWASIRKPLRDALGVTDASPLRDVSMRNNFEHFDERMHEWWDKSTTHNTFDMNFGPASAYGAPDRLDLFRTFDPRTCEIAFWGDRFDGKAVIEEIRRVHDKLSAEADMPLMPPEPST